MILATMNAAEYLREFIRDSDKVNFFLRSREKKARKAFRDTFRYPKIYREDYVVPASGNRYVVYYYADRAEAERKMNVNGFFYVGDRNVGGQKEIYQLRMKHSGMISIDIYTVHFFQRYRERVLREGSRSFYDDVVTFLGRTGFLLPYPNTQAFNRNTDRTYDPNNEQIACSTMDGIIYGEAAMHRGRTPEEVICVVTYRTIVPRSMLKEEQLEAERAGVTAYMDKWKKEGYDPFLPSYLTMPPEFRRQQ